MTSTRDKIARIVFDHWSLHGPTDSATADAIIAALPDMVPELVWVRARGNTSYAKSPFGNYAAWDDGFRDPRGGVHQSCAPKADANAHHRERVMQALGLTGKETECAKTG